MTTTNIATININGITSPTRMQMLRNFIYKQDIDILFMQEAAHPSLDKLNGYTVHYNIGTEQRGTAIVARDNIELANITRIPSGRTIAAEYKGIWLVNIYAPSGAAKKNEREQFFNSELTYILRAAPEEIVLGGDFNCILEKSDTTGHPNYSRALAQLIQGLALRDAWEINPSSHAYTHYSSIGATRIDRIYLSHKLYPKKTSIVTIPAAFTDHLAVVLRMTVETPLFIRGRGIWKLKTAIAATAETKHKLHQQWNKWSRLKRCYPNVNMWWERLIKKKLRYFYRQEQNKDYVLLENHYYECIYDIIAQNSPHEEKLPKLNRLKAKIVKMHSDRLKTIALDTQDTDQMDDEHPTIYHISQKTRRRTQRTIRQIVDDDGCAHRNPMKIVSTFANHFRQKYSLLVTHDESMNKMLDAIHPAPPERQITPNEQAVTLEEIKKSNTERWQQQRTWSRRHRNRLL